MSSDDILIFSTSITKKQDIKQMETLFAQYPQIYKWSMDFEDWEKVLRIESQDITADNIIDALGTIGIIASELK
ncbi:hypothetical protein [Bacteroides thetaiotaomicron]|uniref:hypothetical protein n=1 Tax=Bacteroides thetaiotaomicron TaxID=818 RepID=UPI0039C1BEA0